MEIKDENTYMSRLVLHFQAFNIQNKNIIIFNHKKIRNYRDFYEYCGDLKFELL